MSTWFPSQMPRIVWVYANGHKGWAGLAGTATTETGRNRKASYRALGLASLPSVKNLPTVPSTGRR